LHRSDADHKFVSIEKNIIEKLTKFLHLLQAAIEIPYVFIQVLLYTFIVYPTIGYYWTAYKVLWFFYATFCSVLSYVYVGLLLASLSPNVQVATILGSFFNTMQTLFSGFILPAPVSLDLFVLQT
jgi:ABC-type multidrug transport system permease subunit